MADTGMPGVEQQSEGGDSCSQGGEWGTPLLEIIERRKTLEIWLLKICAI